MQFLSQEWLDELARLAAPPTADDVSATVELQVTGGPAGDLRAHVVLVHGVLHEAAVGPAPAADLVLTVPHPEAVDMARGVLDPNVAYMRGRLKTTGDDGALLALLSRARSPVWRGLLEQLDARTEY
jgi:hypothetical protein